MLQFTPEEEVEERELRIKQVHAQFNSSNVSMMFMLYPSLIITTFKLFNCEELDSSSKESTVLVADMSQRCYGNPHLYYMLLLGLPMMVLYVIGFPLSCCYYLWKHRGDMPGSLDVRTDLTVEEKYNIKRNRMSLYLLYHGYKPKYFMFEILIMMRKAFIASFAVFVLSHSAQANLAVLLIFFSFMVQLKLEPFEDRMCNSVELAGLSTSFLTFAAFVICGDIVKTIREGKDFDKSHKMRRNGSRKTVLRHLQQECEDSKFMLEMTRYGLDERQEVPPSSFERSYYNRNVPTDSKSSGDAEKRQLERVQQSLGDCSKPIQGDSKKNQLASSEIQKRTDQKQHFRGFTEVTLCRRPAYEPNAFQRFASNPQPANNENTSGPGSPIRLSSAPVQPCSKASGQLPNAEPRNHHIRSLASSHGGGRRSSFRRTFEMLGDHNADLVVETINPTFRQSNNSTSQGTGTRLLSSMQEQKRQQKPRKRQATKFVRPGGLDCEDDDAAL
eukprot:jgi/Bigna1/143428/aug1.78_g18136